MNNNLVIPWKEIRCTVLIDTCTAVLHCYNVIEYEYKITFYIYLVHFYYTSNTKPKARHSWVIGYNFTEYDIFFHF